MGKISVSDFPKNKNKNIITDTLHTAKNSIINFGDPEIIEFFIFASARVLVFFSKLLRKKLLFLTI